VRTESRQATRIEILALQPRQGRHSLAPDVILALQPRQGRHSLAPDVILALQPRQGRHSLAPDVILALQPRQGRHSLAPDVILALQPRQGRHSLAPDVILALQPRQGRHSLAPDVSPGYEGHKGTSPGRDGTSSHALAPELRVHRKARNPAHCCPSGGMVLPASFRSVRITFFSVEQNVRLPVRSKACGAAPAT